MSSASAEKEPSLITTGLIVVSVIFPILSLIATCLRYKVRRRPGQGLGADDWWLAVSWIFSFAISITIWTFAGISGVNFYTVDPYTASIDANLCLWIASWFNQVSLTTVKIAILIFYKRIFPVKSFHVVTWIVIAAVSCWGIIFFFLTICWGDPISKAWTGVGVWRYDVTATGLANVGCSICLDVLVLSLPLPVISRLHLPLRKKFAISLIFWLGIFCCICSIVRLVLLHEVLYQVVASADSIGVQSTQFCFLVIEPHCSIIAASLPCYGPLLAGVRGPESMLRSIRSVFSLASRDTANSDNGTHKRKTSSTNPQTYDESPAELQKRNESWLPHQHDYNAVISSKDGHSSQSDGDIHNESQGAITVTRGLDVVTDTTKIV
ncbi:uncharacterized protein GGS22DRAFT_149182 [Annulohypoxylon maeteangense]|uniref:uncharacterized protein n=1 Tax=Annulohypoxylon maeteangense TaxID=1927788 RepID=UPI002007C60A|nr:uncharacterized protein GGS22DRAFT_149182 [Annulohypoxylon maeteangense]KAI0889800.1 hypothetical protein GGS22DRAFT_149182 [Annulohypoxylon maeteangense]